MRILVTGGAGFIGSHLTDALLAQGHEVVVWDNLVTGSMENLAHLDGHPRFSFVRHDVTEPPPDAGPLDRIYHLASPASPEGYRGHPIETHMTNAVGTHRALELARAHDARFLLTSTSEAYGDPLEHPQRETYRGNVNPVGERSCYDESKRFAESLTMEYHRTYGGRINTKLIRAQWLEIQRLAASIQQGTVTASLMLRKLASYPRQNSLALALRELGRIERTLFTLDWLRDPALRQQVYSAPRSEPT